ncbi:hypothetical protein R1sor_012297 [Riccia sorocarpa]|uniref:chitinase n=1 Tax=Riccia sorocarpa TaxID=122646 RepID=A0ABD3I4L9_9MARC
MGTEKSFFSGQMRIGVAMIVLLVSAVNPISAGQIAGYWGQDVSEIKSCQSRGIKVLLSLGGATKNYGFNSADEARSLAQEIWDKYLGGNGNRPLGDAQLDGIDLDIENGRSAFYPDLGGRLREIAQNNNYKKLYISAAPQCPFPDNSLGPQAGKFLSTTLADFVFVQFYNNPGCDFRSGSDAVVKAYQQWTNGLPKAQVFMGLLASSSTTSSDKGFVESGAFKNSILPKIKSIGNYGGVMLWKPSSDGGSYATAIKSFV